MADWTEDRIAEARRLWEEGYSASLIAEKIGNGATKNAIIGKAHRGKWGQRRPAYQRPNPLNERIKAARLAKAKARTHAAKAQNTIIPPNGIKAKPKPPPPPPKPRKKPGTYTLLDLRHGECKWPVNAPPRGGEYLFCGKWQFNGHPYCEHHARLGFSGKGTARKAEVAGWQPRAEGWR